MQLFKYYNRIVLNGKDKASQIIPLLKQVLHEKQIKHKIQNGNEQAESFFLFTKNNTSL